MIDREKVIKALDLCKYDPDPGQTLKHIHSCANCPYWNDGIMPECSVMYTDAIVLLKEQDKQKRKWLQNITDNQLANASDGWPEAWHEYQAGVWHGLQMAYEILTEE